MVMTCLRPAKHIKLGLLPVWFIKLHSHDICAFTDVQSLDADRGAQSSESTHFSVADWRVVVCCSLMTRGC